MLVTGLLADSSNVRNLPAMCYEDVSACADTSSWFLHSLSVASYSLRLGGIVDRYQTLYVRSQLRGHVFVVSTRSERGVIFSAASGDC